MTNQDMIWVTGELDPARGTYAVTISAGEDRARKLKPTEAVKYAAAVLAAAARAEHDAAVGRQLQTKLGTVEGEQSALEQAAAVISQLRADRPPINRNHTYPVTFEPGVNTSMKPFIAIHLDGQDRPGQLTPAAARAHAMHVLEAVAVADLDTAYLQALRARMHLDEHTAQAVVSDLAHHRHDADQEA